ncbi:MULTISPECIES: acyl-CoA dehydrogenase family protein [unclassified Streptomyces]|uniref:acyl-CoA dehydrogenase family protein n=1 Tax=unclassified Streptomyces TaxID=2593676 RepID=UPI002E772BCF|nr:acyl-CoA dehydrogenase family protein [Streptomyces sp. JV184]MEE1750520.1 acyl-CoA/acyl-ACP dehydrogenase [Streptomyces sp. JV184]
MTSAAAPATAAEALERVDALRDTLLAGGEAADRAAGFPDKGVDALKAAGLLSAAIPAEYGGSGLAAPALAELAARIGRCCGSTGMIWAMHQLQLACLVPSAAAQPELADYLRTAAAEQHLVASVTSEAGIGGNLRMSKAALVQVGEEYLVEKHATTVSYGEQADSLLVTARRDDRAAADDQVLVLVRAEQARLRRTGPWNTLGMRGTCSSPQHLQAVVPRGQVLAEPFGAIAGRVMVPLSHILWAAVWTGIATDAFRRAVRFSQTKAKATRRGSTFAPDPRLGRMHAVLTMLRAHVQELAAEFAESRASGGSPRDLTVPANALKVSASEESVRVAVLALEVCGMAGYSEEGEFSVARHLRDLYSGRIMIANDKLTAVNTELLLTGEDFLD